MLKLFVCNHLYVHLILLQCRTITWILEKDKNNLEGKNKFYMTGSYSVHMKSSRSLCGRHLKRKSYTQANLF